MSIPTRLSNSRLARFSAAALSGVVLALSFPNAAIWPLALIALGPLIAAAAHARSKREAFLLGELAMTVTWMINVPWVIDVMAHYGQLGLPLGILIFVAMALFLGMYGGFFALGVRALRPDARFVSWLPVPLLWAAVEYGRTYLFSGFPWNLLATAVVDVPSLAILSAMAGPYALGAFVAFPSTLIAWQLAAATARRERTRTALISVVVLAVVWLGGAFLVRQREATIEPPTRSAAILQPNITQEMRWDSQQVIDIFERMARMTDAAAASRPDVVVWPESTVPLAYLGTPFFQDYVEGISRSSGSDIILGSVAEDGESGKLWNAAYLVAAGQTSGRYDKIRLVPFGEYVPLKQFIFFAEKLVRQVGDFQFGTNEKPLRSRNAYGPAICYEVVFPRIPAKQIANGADVLVTITNDAWFGRSSAPRQHLNQARMRAIEGDRYMLRAATTGISAAIDPLGRIQRSLPLLTEGTILASFSPRQSLTPYVRFGDWFAMLSVVAAAVAIILRRKGVHG
jgi:apolipoprotein N-acyltransferase